MAIKHWQDMDYVGEVQAALRGGPAWPARLLFFAIMTLMIGCIIWASVAELDEITVAAGKVIPSRQVQKIQNLEGGILKEILAREGEVVERDQVILRIDNTGLAANLNEVLAKFYTRLANVARLQAEAEEKTKIDFPSELTRDRPAVAAAEQGLFIARRAQLKSQLDILQSKLDQKRQELHELRNNVQQSERGYSLAMQEYNITKPLVDKGVMSKVDLIRLDQRVNELRGALEGSKLAMPRVQASIQEAEQQLQEKKDQFKSDALTELGQMQAELAQLKEVQVAATDRVVRTEVRSPVRGTVNRILINTIGGVIQPGADVIEIVPIDDSLVVEAKVRPSDIAFLRPNLDAMVKLSAYDFSVYGGLKGQLEHISADTVTDPEKKEEHYIIKVRTEKNYLGTEDKQLTVLPGMVATVDIKTGRKTVLDYLMKPILKARDRAMRER